MTKKNLLNKIKYIARWPGHGDGVLQNPVVQKDNWRLGQGQERYLTAWNFLGFLFGHLGSRGDAN